MADATRCEVGAEVSCADGTCGELIRVVLDPTRRTATHLVVEPRHPRGMARLVPLELLSRGGPLLGLRCSLIQFRHLPAAEEMAVVPAAELGYGEVGSLNGLGGWDGFGSDAAPPVFFDVVPRGEVEVAGGDRVYATDGHIGSARGLVLDPRDRRITHVLMQIGHWWGHHDLALPIADVADLADGIRLRLSRREVQELV